MHPLEETLRDLGGTASTAALLRVVGRRQLTRAVEDGVVVRLGPGLYALPVLDAGLAEEASARRAGAVMSHASAARWYGWSLKHEPERTIVTVPRNRNVPAGVRATLDVRHATVAAGDASGCVTTPARTVIDCARTMPFDEALAVADSALNQRAVTRDDLAVAAYASPRTGRARATRVVESADPRAANVFESVVRAISLQVRGLRLEPQVEITRGIMVDLADTSLRVAVECDSWTYHAEKSAFRRDLERYNTVSIAGWLLLRFALPHALERPDYVLRELGAAVATRAQERTPRR